MKHRTIQVAVGTSWCVALFVTAALSSRAEESSIEIRFRQEPVVPRGIIRLGHIADILGTSPARRRHLERIPIRPAPPRGRSVVIRRADVRRVLHLETGAFPLVEFTGPERVRLDGIGEPQSQTPARRTAVRRTSAPPTDAGAMVVVARRALPRGKLLGPDDVTLVSLTSDQLEAHRAVSWTDTIDQVVGKELRRAVRAGAPIPPDETQPPIAARRREAVDVTVQAGACTVRMTAIALENGRLGEMIRLQNPNGKGDFMARLTGPGRAEVVHAASGERETPVGNPRLRTGRRRSLPSPSTKR